jgi:hypothetical protein
MSYERPQAILARLVAANVRPPMKVTRPRVHLFNRPLSSFGVDVDAMRCPTCGHQSPPQPAKTPAKE